ncbi:MAG: FAD-dependent oxidoreductase, partial [Tepidisphaeraceae bacterium]
MTEPHETTWPHESLNHVKHDVDVCVVGGGMAGLCAAIAAARNGASVCLVHDRPVLGGNASSEVRMWICGAHGKDNKETGILEEILLENLYRNPSLNYSIWDSVLYGKAFFQPGLTTILNCSVLDATCCNGRIASVRGWQLTSQTWVDVHAKLFIDCSGDSILAPLSGAKIRWGREAREEFAEDIQPALPDQKTMGNTLLIQLRKTDEPQPYTPPTWAYKFTKPQDLPHRIHGVKAHNFWWLELGGLQNTIRDAEAIRDDLMRVVYGVWDYIKNHAPEKEEADHWAIEWIGSLPGKRENRRYVGGYTLTQNDVRAGGAFDDIVAYGGWSMDDHHPAGLLYPGKPTIFHPAPSPYGIPYRCLYSANVGNLLFAGRNISVTHAALSSTRVMATCALLGQAAGTAAALCIRHDCDPAAITDRHVPALQETLMQDDVWLPGIQRPASALTRSGVLVSDAGAVDRLIDGTDRDLGDISHAWEAAPGTPITYQWQTPMKVGGVRIVFDSNLANDKRMPCSYPQKGNRNLVPKSLVKAFRIDVLDDAGAWKTVHHEDNNYQRLVCLPVNQSTKGIRLIPESTWGEPLARVFAFEPVEHFIAK